MCTFMKNFSFLQSTPGVAVAFARVSVFEFGLELLNCFQEALFGSCFRIISIFKTQNSEEFCKIPEK